MKYKILFLVLFVPFYVTIGQETLFKQEAIGIALEQNFDIKIANQQVEVATLNAQRENLGYNPTVQATAGGVYNLDNVKATFQDGREAVVNWAPSNNISTAVTANYIVFDGFNRKYQLERGIENVSASQLNARFSLENVLLQLFNAYNNTARISADFRNLQEILAISKERLARATTSFEYGRNSKLDIFNAEVDVNTDSIALLNQAQELRVAKANLNFVLNNAITSDFNVDTTVIFATNLDKELLLANIEKNNVQLLLAKTNIKLSEIDFRLSTTSRLPTVSLNADYGIGRNKSNPASFLDNSLSNGLTGGFNVTWDVFDGGRRRVQEQVAKVNQLNQQLSYDQIKQQVLRDFEIAWSDYQNRLAIWKALRTNVNTSRENFNRSEEKYRLGQITSIEFRLAQSNLITTLNSMNRAKYDAKLSELNVYSTAGKIQEAIF